MCGGLFSFCFLHETVFGNGQAAITHNLRLSEPLFAYPPKNGQISECFKKITNAKSVEHIPFFD